MLQNQAALGIARVEQGARELLVEIRPYPSCDGFYRCYDILDEIVYTIWRHNLTMTDSVPPRFSLRAFERMAPYIGQALTAYPNPIRIQTKLSTRTLARCIQEALTAKRKFGYCSPHIDELLWNAHNAALGTAEVDGSTLLLGDKTHVRKPMEPIASTSPEIEVVNTIEALVDLAYLISNKSLKTSTRFFVMSPDPNHIENLETQFDVAFTPDEQNPAKFYIT